MESTLSAQSRRELLLLVVPRYQKASIAQKGALLDEIAAATGYARRHVYKSPISSAQKSWGIVDKPDH